MAANQLYDSGIKVTGSFSGAGSFPVDGKYIVETIEERDDHVTQNRAYDGMQVYVKADKKTYQYQINSETNEGEWVDFRNEETITDLQTRVAYLEGIHSVYDIATEADIDAMFE